jgi:hypothetical protein
VARHVTFSQEINVAPHHLREHSLEKTEWCGVSIDSWGSSSKHQPFPSAKSFYYLWGVKTTSTRFWISQFACGGLVADQTGKLYLPLCSTGTRHFSGHRFSQFQGKLQIAAKILSISTKLQNKSCRSSRDAINGVLRKIQSPYMLINEFSNMVIKNTSHDTIMDSSL